MKQHFTSKNTSINTKKLPTIYTNINLERLRDKTIFDYGAGKIKTVRLIREKLELYDIDYIPYDIYNLSPADNCYAIERRKEADLYICSNVINVIKEDEIIQMIINEIIKLSNTKPYFFKIYEGNKSGVGKSTKKDCWQRNQKTKDYLQQFDFAGIYAPVIYKGFITNEKGKDLLK